MLNEYNANITGALLTSENSDALAASRLLRLVMTNYRSIYIVILTDDGKNAAFEAFKKTITQDDCENLCKYLIAHKSDIANDINDFGDLKPIFRRFVGIEP